MYLPQITEALTSLTLFSLSATTWLWRCLLASDVIIEIFHGVGHEVVDDRLELRLRDDGAGRQRAARARATTRRRLLKHYDAYC